MCVHTYVHAQMCIVPLITVLDELGAEVEYSLSCGFLDGLAETLALSGEGVHIAFKCEQVASRT